MLMKEMNSNKDLYDPNLLFDKRIRELRQRIQILRNDYQNVHHYFSRAIVKTELDKAEDELLERTFVFQRSGTDREEPEETKNRN